MKKLLFAIAAAATAFAGAEADTYRIDVGEFNELEVNDHINVIYTAMPDSAGYVVFDATPKFASYVMAERSKGKLKIQLDQDAESTPAPLPTVYVYSSYLSKIENTKDSTLTVRSVAPGAKIDIELQGNGKIIADGLDAVSISLKLLTGKGTIIAAGKCDNLSIKNVGTGLIQADEIAAKNVKCHLVGTGTIGCAPLKTLSIKGLGSGKVYYTGNPQISKNKLSNIKVIPLDTDGEEPEEPEDAAKPEEPEAAVEPESPSEEEQPELLDLVENPEPQTVEPSRERKPVIRK